METMETPRNPLVRDYLKIYVRNSRDGIAWTGIAMLIVVVVPGNELRNGSLTKSAESAATGLLVLSQPVKSPTASQVPEISSKQAPKIRTNWRWVGRRAGPEEGPARVAQLLRSHPAAGGSFCAFLAGGASPLQPGGRAPRGALFLPPQHRRKLRDMLQMPWMC